MEIALNELRLGQQGTVISLEAPAGLLRRLHDLGMIPGTQVRCRYRTPCGKVTALDLRGSVIAMRTRDMKNIRVRC